MDTTQKSPIILSLCTGIRGLERGIERAIGTKLRVAAYAEIEAFIVTNLIAGMEAGLLDPAPIWSNLKTFPWGKFRGKIHGIIGGYPCQPFSVAGNRGGADDPRHLWPFIAEGIRTVRPIWCFFENVGGHLTLGYETVRRELQEMGYRVEEGIFSAEEVGAPHRRERMFILAVGSAESYDEWNEEFDGRLRQKQVRGTGSIVAYSYINTIQKWQEFSGVWGEPFRDGKEMEYPTSQRLSQCRRTRFKEFQKEKGCWIYDRPEQSGKIMAHPQYRRSDEDTKYSQLWPERIIEPSCNSGGNDQRKEIKIQIPKENWPAGAGPEQYEWEEPRTIKSGLGCTINGYNFREDLLRAFGNGVVEQTSELAWITLWNKHIIN